MEESPILPVEHDHHEAFDVRDALAQRVWDIFEVRGRHHFLCAIVPNFAGIEVRVLLIQVHVIRVWELGLARPGGAQ